MKPHVAVGLLLLLSANLTAAEADNPDTTFGDCSHTPKLCEVAAKLNLVFSMRSSLSRAEATVTVVAPFSLERLAPLDVQCSLHKDNPYIVFAAAIYVPLRNQKIYSVADDGTNQSDVLNILPQLQDFHEAQTAKGCVVDFTLWQEELPELDLWNTYPVNTLRNKALQMAETEVVALLDGDFVIAPADFGSHFRKGMPMYETAVSVLRNKSVLVMPAFDLHMDHHQTQEVSDTILKATENKQQMLSMSVFKPFQQRFHFNTDYDKWKTSDTMYTVPYKNPRETFPMSYEPYILALKKGLPCYDERYRGYFYNKLQYLYHIARMGYTYVVQPDVYVIHLPHEKVGDLSAQISGEPRRQMSDLCDIIAAALDKQVFKPYVRDGSCDGRY